MKKLLLVLFIFLFTSCLQEVNTEEKIFIVKKGNHSSTLLQIIVPKPVEYSAIVEFDSSAIYKIGTATFWNKLLGFAFVELNGNFVHENSARFVWRWNQNLLQISPYSYIDGEIVKNKVIIERKLYQPIKLKILVDYQQKEYKFYVDDVLISVEKFTHDKKFGLCEWFYFGGDPTAPHTIKIKFKNLTIK